VTQLLLTLLAVWVLLVAVGFAVWPLVSGGGREIHRSEIELRELETEKARLLEELHELELDRETGKLSDADYETLQKRLKGRAVEVMREIAALRGERVLEAGEEDDAGAASDELQAANR